jgi:hypothetical protein
MEEKMRSKIVIGMKVGYTSTLCFGKLVTASELLDTLFGD